MITIKKKNKINELFTTDSSNIFDYKETKDGYVFSDDNEIVYNVIINLRTYGNRTNYIDISYYKDDENYIPTNGKFDTDKVKVLNTVITICKKVIDKIKPFLITFSGNNSNGLAVLYRMIIRSLKLKNSYDIYEYSLTDDTYFSLVDKNFKFIDLGENILAYVPDQGILRVTYEHEGLLLRNVKTFLEKFVITNFSKIISYCIPDNESLKTNWYDEGQDFVKFYWSKVMKVDKDQIEKTIKHMESIGATFRNIEDDIMTFVNSSKL